MDNKVSIIIPVYNTAQFLSKSINSCLVQTFQNIEIIIVIDGSRDNAFEIAKEYQDRDNRVFVINKEHEGLPKSRRVGFESSTGKYIFHLDADDYLEPEAITVLIETLVREQADIVVGGTIYENKDGERFTTWISKVTGNNKIDYLRDIFSSNLQPNIWGRLIKREIFQPVLVPSQYNCGEDYIANVMMICYSPEIKIVPETELLYHYVVYSESLTNTWPAEVFMPYTEIIGDILIKSGLEDLVMYDWAYYRMVKSWRYYLRRGGITYLKDKKFVGDFYGKYFHIVKDRLKFVERIELILYKYNQPLAWNFSKIYIKCIKIRNKLSI
jgi:glycosyltransferase involved in cell wall biosynthesis